MDHKKIQSLKDLGQVIQEERKKRSLTQEQLAARTGVSRRFIYQLENASRETFPLGKVLQVLKRLNLEISISTRVTE